MSSPSAGPSSPRPGAGANDILPATHWAQQPVEAPAEDDDDNDSAYGESTLSSTASLTSSILQYRTIQGRTYHSDMSFNAEYWGANDERQSEAMDIIHHALTLVLNGALYRAPLDTTQPLRVLDIGTGTGVWAIDFADAHPNCQVTGTDLSPIQPGWVPPNLFFEIEDATQHPWTFAPNSVDYVHMRYLFGSVADWDELFRQAYRVLKPGGYVETFESDGLLFSEDGTLTEGCALDQWGKVFKEAGERFGRSFVVVGDDLQRRGLEAAGFGGLEVWDFKCPMSGWPADRKLREIGEYIHASLEQDMEGMVLYTLKEILGWNPVEIYAFVAQLRKELREKKVHALAKLRCIVARKPLDAPAAS